MKRKLLAILMIGTVLMTAACGKPAENTAAEAAPTPEPTMSVEAFGIIEANSIENISLDVEAVVEKVSVKEGQRVKEGDILLSLDMKAYTERILSKQRDLRIVRLEAEKLAGESSNPDIQKLANDLKYAEEQLKKAEAELASQEKLYKSGAISKYEYEEYVKAVESKSKAAKDIKYSFDSLMRSNGLDSAIQAEKAAVIESEIRQLKEKLDRSYISGSDIICPVDNGIVYELGYKPGDTINAEKKVLSLMDMNTLVVKANVAEEFIKDVKLGAKVEIIPVADKAKQYQGKVTAIAQKAQVQNGETVIPVEISIENKDSFLLPNFNVDVRIFME